MFAVSGGKTKPPKHIVLPFVSKSLSGNTELIRTLKRLGRGAPYTQTQAIDMALCIQKISEYNGDPGIKGDCLRLRASPLCQGCRNHLDA